jgi:cysteine desulfurase/selenocysteine lyase
LPAGPNGDLTAIISRLANELWSAFPGSADVARAADDPAAGASGAGNQVVKHVPTNAPPGGGLSVGTLLSTPPTLIADLPLGLGGLSDVNLATPYFLDLAGHPIAASTTGAPAPDPAAAPPSSAAPAAAPVWSSDVHGLSLGEPPALALDTGSARRGLFDPAQVKRDFPILRERVHGRPLVWLDNAATTQKPSAVIDRLSYFYEHENSNVHRAAHTLAARATDAYEGARDKVRRFLSAPSAKNVVFTRGTTEAINLVAKSWGKRHVAAGDEIVISWLEHHANIVPWQQLAAETGARLRVAPVDDRGQVRLDEFEKLLGPRTRLVSVSQVSNALGTIVPVAEIVAMGHRHGARVMIDGAQAVSHMAVDVQALDCDFYCFSGHKIFGPTGIGALYGKTEVLDEMPPWQGGGNMISDVTFEKTTFNPPPGRFEAGTGNIADAVGLGAALDYVTELGLPNIGRHEHDLLEYGTKELGRVPGLRIIGTAPEKAGVLSFVIDGLRTEDLGHALDQEGIAVRAGHHCAQPILRRFGLESTVRASLAPYNTCEDIDALVDALLRLTGSALGR